MRYSRTSSHEGHPHSISRSSYPYHPSSNESLSSYGPAISPLLTVTPSTRDSHSTKVGIITASLKGCLFGLVLRCVVISQHAWFEMGGSEERVQAKSRIHDCLPYYATDYTTDLTD